MNLYVYNYQIKDTNKYLNILIAHSIQIIKTIQIYNSPISTYKEKSNSNFNTIVDGHTVPK